MKYKKNLKGHYKHFLSVYHAVPFSLAVNNALWSLHNEYRDFISIQSIGNSVKGVPLIAAYMGTGPKKILIHGTHHAREAITTILVLDQISYLAYKAKHNYNVGNINICKLLSEITFVFVPLVNPDGADLVLNGKKSLGEYEQPSFMKNEDICSWKANIRGVDLNENYPTQYLSIYLTDEPGPSGYPGKCFFSEPETLALKNLTEHHAFSGTISYHSSGQEIYWYYNQNEEQRDLKIAKAIAKLTGYTLIPATKPSHGSGYKDWYIENYHQPALTIEVSPYV